MVVWFYATLSFVNIIYGSLASAVVFLLTVEFAALILLLGAQVIAELETYKVVESNKIAASGE